MVLRLTDWSEHFVSSAIEPAVTLEHSNWTFMILILDKSTIAPGHLNTKGTPFQRLHTSILEGPSPLRCTDMCK